MEQIVAAIIGGFLAASTGWLLDWRREKAKLSNARKLLTTGICDDLQHANSLYEKIIEDWEKTKTVWFSTLNELRESRQTYQNNKDWVTIFEDAELRKKIFRYYLQSADAINNLEYQQRRKYEIENRLNEVVRNLKMQDSALSQEQAVKTALGYMEAESKEYDNLVQSIPGLVNKLAQHKSTAESLRAQLKQLK